MSRRGAARRTPTAPSRAALERFKKSLPSAARARDEQLVELRPEWVAEWRQRGLPNEFLAAGPAWRALDPSERGTALAFSRWRLLNGAMQPGVAAFGFDEQILTYAMALLESEFEAKLRAERELGVR